MTRNLPRTAVALTVTAVLLSACARDQPIIDYGPAPTAAPATAVPDDGRGFFATLRPALQSVTLKNQPETLTEAYAETTAVVEAAALAVRPGRVIGEPAMQTVIVDLMPLRVLRGALQPELRSVSVEVGIGWEPSQIGDVVRRMNADPPSRAVWLLRWQGKPAEHRKTGVPPRDRTADLALYRTIHPNCSIFVQGRAGVEAPSSQDVETTRDTQAEAERFATLEELADHAVRA